MSDTPSRGACGPDHRDLYLLVLGILAGVVLGRLAPTTYHRMFVGDQAVFLERQKFEREYPRQMQATLDVLRATGVTETAVTEKRIELEQQNALRQKFLEARSGDLQYKHDQRLGGLLTALLLAMVAFMAVEALVDPATGFRKVIASVRYALMAVWIAVVLGHLQVLRDVPVALVLGAILVALGAAGLAQVLPGLLKGKGGDV